MPQNVSHLVDAAAFGFEPHTAAVPEGMDMGFLAFYPQPHLSGVVVDNCAYGLTCKLAADSDKERGTALRR